MIAAVGPSPASSHARRAAGANMGPSPAPARGRGHGARWIQEEEGTASGRAGGRGGASPLRGRRGRATEARLVNPSLACQPHPPPATATDPARAAVASAPRLPPLHDVCQQFQARRRSATSPPPGLPRRRPWPRSPRPSPIPREAPRISSTGPPVPSRPSRGPGSRSPGPHPDQSAGADGRRQLTRPLALVCNSRQQTTRRLPGRGPGRNDPAGQSATGRTRASRRGQVQHSLRIPRRSVQSTTAEQRNGQDTCPGSRRQSLPACAVGPTARGSRAGREPPRPGSSPSPTSDARAKGRSATAAGSAPTPFRPRRHRDEGRGQPRRGHGTRPATETDWPGHALEPSPPRRRDEPSTPVQARAPFPRAPAWAARTRRPRPGQATDSADAGQQQAAEHHQQPAEKRRRAVRSLCTAPPRAPSGAAPQVQQRAERCASQDPPTRLHVPGAGRTRAAAPRHDDRQNNHRLGLRRSTVSG